MKLSIRKKKILLWCGAASAGYIAVTGALLLSLTGDPAAFMRFVHTWRMIHSAYFRDVSDTSLWDGASEGMVRALEDPYSQLLMGQNFDNFMSQTSGEYGGIGVVVGEDGEGDFRVLAVFPEGPASQSGLVPGDTVTAVDGQPVAGHSLDEVAQALRGEAGTAVAVTVHREEEDLTVSVTRSNVSLPTVQGELLENSIGYVHIYSFAKHTPEEFQREYQRLSGLGMEKLILDLRMNPGGMIDSVVAVADQLLTAGTIVSYQEKDGHKDTFSIKGVEHPIPMVVLIDKNSASASEILAGAVQDKKEGIIMGETSFGKGTVQVVLPMAGQEALKLSIAQYLTAAGRKIDKIGIQPDVAVPQTGRIFDLSTDNVLQRAIQYLQNR